MRVFLISSKSTTRVGDPATLQGFGSGTTCATELHVLMVDRERVYQRVSLSDEPTAVPLSCRRAGTSSKMAML